MDSLSSGPSLQLLAKLLHDTQEDDDDDEQVPHCSVNAMTPGTIGPGKRETTDTFQVKPGNDKAIWNTEEVPEGSEFEDSWDPREQPECLMKMLNQTGPRTHPCGTPLATGLQPDSVPLISTLWALSFSQFSIHLTSTHPAHTA
ncbi:dynein axonemal assembly factor 6-like [Colius striatus]|uniref:dynein axonemal assembly factor 6-like n=2 Tax=Colius striatus TaxID=57412 RepID=UPI002B1D1A23|nr:dynein axonemal assembly factor 6-like [Colius striatus]XP_061862891.1 dynein axonemal assembly factor 6-like [Colius striatus]